MLLEHVIEGEQDDDQFVGVVAVMDRGVGQHVEIFDVPLAVSQVPERLIGKNVLGFEFRPAEALRQFDAAFLGGSADFLVRATWKPQLMAQQVG